MNKKSGAGQAFPALAGIILLVCLDQLSKIGAIRYLKGDGPFVIWKGVFELQYLENRGAAFGILQNQRIFFVLITIVVLAVAACIFRLTPAEKKYLPLQLCIVFLAAGAVGNLIDRLFRGFVVDFFYFSLIHFPIFNVADIYVTVSFCVLVLLLLFYYKEEDLAVYRVREGKDEK